MDLTFQVPMRYCSLQHKTLLLSPVTSTPGCCFCFGSVSSFFLELFLHWSPVAYWAPTDLGKCPIFLPFILFMGFSRQEYWSGHSLLQWTTFCQNSPPWSIHLVWPYMTRFIVSLSYTELWSMWLDQLVFCDCWFQSLCHLMKKNKRLIMEASWWERLTEG